ncbi:MAG TPA: Gfo/Idh/MocA family oxidoreductase [Planctomycetota bacterium]|nr:Gfo/Idh/MocA family oxidoreductase [Planctomycetota bacterium]
MIRLAIVGCGVHSEFCHAVPLARFVREHPGELALVAACDLDPDRAGAFRGKYGFERAYTDMRAMLAAEKPDGVVCVVPVELIGRVNSELFRAGVPSTIEKPPGASRAEVRAIARLARETGARHMVSANRRFTPLLARAVEWARAQGPVHYVRAAMIRHARREPDFIWGTAFHAVDALRFAAGEVAGFSLSASEPGAGAGDLSARWYDVSVNFAGGARGRLEVLVTAGMAEESYDLFGEGYRARVVGPVRQGQLQPGTRLDCWRDNRLVLSEEAGPDEPVDVIGGSYGEVGEFVAALREGRAPRPTLDDVLPSAELCFSLAEAAGVLPAEGAGKGC